MQPAAPAPDTAAQPEAAPAPSFMDAVRAAQSAPAPEPAPVAEPAPASPAAPGTPPTPAADPNEWVKSLGDDYKSPDEVKTALASLDALRANQLTDDHRALLTLAQDPAAWQEYNNLTHQDPKALSDEQALFADFKKQHAGIDEESLRVLFEEDQDKKYPGLAEAPEHAMHKAHAAKQKLDAERVRTGLTQTREARLTELKKGALPAQAPTPEQTQAEADAILSAVDKLLDSHKDGYKMTVDVDGGAALNLMVEPKDLPAFKAVMADPLSALLTEDKKSFDPQKLLEFAAFRTQGRALLADAYKAGQQGGGPRVDVRELHNADGTPIPPAAGGDGSFLGALQKAAPAQPKLNY